MLGPAGVMTKILFGLSVVASLASTAGADDHDPPPIAADQSPRHVDPPPRGSRPGYVYVHLDSNDPDAELAHQTGESSGHVGTIYGGANYSSEDWEYLCAAPCDREVEGNQKYVVKNVSGWNGSTKSFVLHPGAAVDIEVKSHSKIGYLAGFVGTTAAASTLGIGIALAAVGFDGGETMAIISAPVLLVSLYVMLHNRSHVEVHVAGAQQSVARRSRSRNGFGVTATGVGWQF